MRSGEQLSDYVSRSALALVAVGAGLLPLVSGCSDNGREATVRESTPTAVEYSIPLNTSVAEMTTSTLPPTSSTTLPVTTTTEYRAPSSIIIDAPVEEIPPSSDQVVDQKPTTDKAPDTPVSDHEKFMTIINREVFGLSLGIKQAYDEVPDGNLPGQPSRERKIIKDQDGEHVVTTIKFPTSITGNIDGTGATRTLQLQEDINGNLEKIITIVDLLQGEEILPAFKATLVLVDGEYLIGIVQYGTPTKPDPDSNPNQSVFAPGISYLINLGTSEVSSFESLNEILTELTKINNVIVNARTGSAFSG